MAETKIKAETEAQKKENDKGMADEVVSKEKKEKRKYNKKNK